MDDENMLRLLSDREEVIETTMSLIESSTERCLGMGRQIAWIDHPPLGEREKSFKQLIEEAVQRNVDVRVLASNEGQVRVYAEEFADTGSKVRYIGDKDYGDIRIAICDMGGSKEAVVAFPEDATEIKSDRGYMGIHITDDKLCHLIEKRFDDFWDAGYTPTYKYWIDAIKEFRHDSVAVYASIISSLLTLVAAFITVISFIL